MTMIRAASALRSALADASHGLIEREALLELVALAAVAREHLLVIGPPGTAKSEAVRRVARALGGRYFEYLLGRFTEPSELFGPVDLRKLRDGIVETQTANMLPEADIAFLDEVFLGSTAILNALLGLLHERVFRRGHSNVACPLRVCVGASNALPDDEQLAAFADRFLVRVFVEPVPDAHLEDLLEAGSAKRSGERSSSIADLDRLADAAEAADLSAVRPRVALAVRTLRSAGIGLSDRRVVKLQRLIAAAAVLAGRAAPSAADLWPIVTAIPTREGQALARDVLRDLLAETENATLPVAAEEASSGPLARARRIVAAGRALLDTGSSDGERNTWRAKLEGIAREIDAGFAPEALPPDLAGLRGEIVTALETP
jgi:MoxR-like ATPase